MSGQKVPCPEAQKTRDRAAVQRDDEERKHCQRLCRAPVDRKPGDPGATVKTISENEVTYLPIDPKKSDVMLLLLAKTPVAAFPSESSQTD